VSNSETQAQAWQAAYVSTILEADPVEVSARIVEAQLAIERRLLEGSPPNALEHQGIKAARNALAALKDGRNPRNGAIEAMMKAPIHQPHHSPGPVLGRQP
jgi:hypothetical protein